MIDFQQFALDSERDMLVDLTLEGERLFYTIRTPNHHTGNLITNLAKLCGLETELDSEGLKVIRGEVPCYFDGANRRMYIFRLGNTKVANIFPDGRVEMKASIPAISKTLMSQTKDYRLGIEKTIVKTYIRGECKFRTDLHTHMNGNLPPEALIALGIHHQLRYPLYYIKKLGLSCTPAQWETLSARRLRAEEKWGDAGLTGKYRDRRIDDHTYINFADLILGNPGDAAENIRRIRNSLTIPKDGQAVFADLEKVYLYRYVFTRGQRAESPFMGLNTEGIPNREVGEYVRRMWRDREDERYAGNTLYQDLLLWIAREYQRRGIVYAEISDTRLLNRQAFPRQLREIHEIMPAITRETGVTLRFLAGIRRIPLTIVRDQTTSGDYLADNLRVLRMIADDPYVAGSDIIGEELNDILELRPVFRALTAIARDHPGFVIRVHAGENDSLRDNVANSIRCVRESLAEGQKMPILRIGHGLYTRDLRSPRGQALLEEMKDSGAVLEFQITSNVRLNNLSSLEHHPLRQYLEAGVKCVQGTDGAALYGTDSIDEQLSLEKLLELSFEEMCQMAGAEGEVLQRSLEDFRQKSAAFREARRSVDVEGFYEKGLEGEQISPESASLWQGMKGNLTEEGLRDLIRPLPLDRLPIVIAGGSFNSSQHRTRVREEDKRLIDDLLNRADPEKVIFLVGHTLSGQEGYLVRRNQGRFQIFAIVPARLSRAEQARLRAAGVSVCVSIESAGMGIYKSFSYEIFNRRTSVLLAFDGNSAALNLIQKARNGKHRCAIFVSPRSRGLAAKAVALDGYVRPLEKEEPILEQIRNTEG